jgi:DNA-binding transcriptional regulator YiaG
MTAKEFRGARRKLGLSARGMANALDMGEWGSRTVRRWEAGDSPIPGPAAVAVKLLIESAKS